MNNINRKLVGLLGFCAAAGMASAAQAGYFVRPYAQLGGSVIDGYEANGATSKDVGFSDSHFASVNLDDGTVHNYLRVNGPSVGGSGAGQSAGIFGDQLVFYGAQGTSIDFSFAFDGTIEAPERTGLSSLQVGVFANFYVFETGSGATYTNFTSHPGALIARTQFLNYLNPTEDLYEFIDETLSGSIVATSSVARYDLFAGLSVFAAMNDNSGTAVLDFLHTGTFDITVAPTVTYSSQSNVFLSSSPAPAVPEPATWAMMVVAFGVTGALMRRRRTPQRALLPGC